MNKQKVRVNVPLPSTILHAKRIADVELPLVYDVPAVASSLVFLTLVMWFVSIGNVLMVVHDGLWFFGVFEPFFVTFAACITANLMARIFIGTQKIIIDNDGLLDTRYSKLPMPWSAFSSANFYACRNTLGSKVFNVILSYLGPSVVAPPMIIYLAINPLPFRLQQRMIIDLWTVSDGEIAASAIAFFVNRHISDMANATR